MPTNWSKARIIFELKEAGINAAALAKENGLSRSTLYSAMERPYPRVQSLIASALQCSRQDIWPHFYGAGDLRLSRREQINRQHSKRVAA